jgi:hypothetical protein
MVAHAVGMLGPCDDIWWWDHLTHTVIGTILGEAVHVTARERGSDRVLTSSVPWLDSVSCGKFSSS